MRAIWSGTVRSTNRVDRTTGQPIEYRLVAYDDGTATCTCPDWQFQGARHPSRSSDQKLRYRCKHLTQAISEGRFSPSETPPPAARPPVAVPAVPEPPPLFDDDDEEYFEPQVRR